MNSTRCLIKYILLLSLAFILTCSKSPHFEIHEEAAYDRLFKKNSGWTGADGAYSIALSDNKTLWVYGDTWIGKIKNNKHVDAALIRNSIAIQYGQNPNHASIQFFSGRGVDETSNAFFKPIDNKGWFWIYHGLLTNKGLYLFLIQIENTGNTSSAGFKIIGTWLAHVLNPNDSPATWQVKYRKIPWQTIADSGDTLFGSSLLMEDSFIYIYGTSEDINQGSHHKYMILARAPATALEKFNSWHFYSKGNWTKDFSLASRLCGDMANEYTVSYLPIYDKYVVVYSENSASENIMIRLAPKPYGPWTHPISIYKCPEVTWDSSIYCYAAKAHPALSSSPDELLITYIASSNDFWKIVADARLYRPRFLRLKFYPAKIFGKNY